ncbi:MAG TPA: bacteriohemerythrin [Burkholderiales bacterium]|jgi:hemerythrin-like metal-binding protein
MLVEWREEFRVGVPSVDHEHQELIALINAVHDRLNAPHSTMEIGDFLGEIFARISAHFALEERIMRAAGYSRYAEHKADHERLLDEIRDIMDDHEDRRVFDERQLGERLGVWFTEHFKTHDAHLHLNLGA